MKICLQNLRKSGSKLIISKMHQTLLWKSPKIWLRNTRKPARKKKTIDSSQTQGFSVGFRIRVFLFVQRVWGIQRVRGFEFLKQFSMFWRIQEIGDSSFQNRSACLVGFSGFRIRVFQKKVMSYQTCNPAHESVEWSNRSENIINRKNSKFYIEIVSNFFSQLQQKIFFRSVKKIFSI